MDTEDWVLLIIGVSFVGYLAFLAFLRSQPPSAQGSTVVVERTDTGWIIVERPTT